MYPVEICASKRKWWRVVKLVNICLTPCVAEFISLQVGAHKAIAFPETPTQNEIVSGTA